LFVCLLKFSFLCKEIYFISRRQHWYLINIITLISNIFSEIFAYRTSDRIPKPAHNIINSLNKKMSPPRIKINFNRRGDLIGFPKIGKVLHCKKRLTIFPPLAGMSITKLSLAGNNLIFPALRESLVSDISAGDGKIAIHFLQCNDLGIHCTLLKGMSTRPGRSRGKLGGGGRGGIFLTSSESPTWGDNPIFQPDGTLKFPRWNVSTLFV
jgi:hypothetical protein